MTVKLFECTRCESCPSDDLLILLAEDCAMSRITHAKSPDSKTGHRYGYFFFVPHFLAFLA